MTTKLLHATLVLGLLALPCGSFAQTVTVTISLAGVPGDIALGSQPLTPTTQSFTPGYTTYVVKPGDSLSRIARMFWGDPMLWPLLYGANRDKIENPSLIYPGQVLIVPNVAPADRRELAMPGKQVVPPYVPDKGLTTATQSGATTTRSPEFPAWFHEASSLARRTWRFPSVTNRYGQTITHEDYIKAILLIESRGVHSRPGQTTLSSAGAIGFMQLMPDTARSVGVDPKDPRQNLLGGVGYLARVLTSPVTQVPGDSPADILVKAAAGYNKGPYDRSLGSMTWNQYVRTSSVRETVRYGITLKMALGIDLTPAEEDWIARDKNISIQSVASLQQRTFQERSAIA